MFQCFMSLTCVCKVGKVAKIWNRYNQVPQLTQDTVWESDKYKKNQIYESQEVSIFTAGDHKDE